VPGSLVGWPKNAVTHFLSLLKNAEANAEAKGLDTAALVVSHVQVGPAPKGRRRTYRAHGRINAYMSNPAHVQLILAERPAEVAKEAEKVAPKLFVRKTAARQRVTTGGGH
jgi:large subunit ribosomal protein L17e